MTLYVDRKTGAEYWRNPVKDDLIERLERAHQMFERSRSPKGLIGAVADTYPYEKADKLAAIKETITALREQEAEYKEQVRMRENLAQQVIQYEQALEEIKKRYDAIDLNAACLKPRLLMDLTEAIYWDQGE